MTAAEERGVLKDLVESDGWRLYLAHVEDTWGPMAFERTIDEALKDCPPEEERSLISRMRDTFKGVRADSRWPVERLRALSEPEPATGAASALYAAFRRRHA